MQSLRLIFFGLFIWPMWTFSQFINVTDDLGVSQVTTGFHIFGHGVSLQDFDGDGLDDISFGTTSQPPQFYRNTGDGFELVEFGLTSPENTIKSILWADIDNDGDKDLFLSYENNYVRLYEQTAPLQLTEITLDSGIELEFGFRNAGAAFGDYNNDGFLDLYLCKYYNNQIFSGSDYENKLYRNNGDNTFTDVTASANASVGVNASFMPAWFDYNLDGWQDIFIVNDRILSPNHLLRNNGDGTFTEVGTSVGIDASIDAMCFSLGDFNNDLLLDFFVANNQFWGNHLYRNNGDETYDEIGASSGVIAFDLCWSGLWMDYDNNGWLDLHVATEFTDPENPPRNYFFVNSQDETFSEEGVQLGLELDNHSTYATAQGDWNMDGYPDFVSHCAEPFPSKLWQNVGGDYNFLAVKLEGVLSNRDAIGSTIYCFAGGIMQMRYMACGENFLSQDSHRKIFGLGAVGSVDSLVVTWLSGHVDRFYNIPVNQTLQIVEGSGLENTINVDGPLWVCPGDTVWLDAGVWDSYSWNTGDTSRWLAVTQPGAYSVETQLEQLPVHSDTVEVSWFNPPIVVSNVTNVLCFGGSDGSIELFNQGGTGLSQVIWSPKGIGENIQNLSAGVYTYFYTDANGCVDEGTLEVFQPPPLFWSTDTTLNSEICPGQWYGELSVTGGTPGYEVDWVVSELGSGVIVDTLFNTTSWCIGAEYPIEVVYTIVDANGCSVVDDIILPNTTSIEVEEFRISAGLNVFPNPSSGRFIITSVLNQVGGQIYDRTGRLLKVLSFNRSVHNELNLNQMDKGLYWLRIDFEDGSSKVAPIQISH